jgi:hypothetical protein
VSLPYAKILNTLETLHPDIKVLGEHNLEILEHPSHVNSKAKEIQHVRNREVNPHNIHIEKCLVTSSAKYTWKRILLFTIRN